MAKSAFRRLIAAAGAPAWCRITRRSRLRVLMYHRFSGEGASLDAALSRQFAHIRRHYDPVSMGDVARSWQTGEPLPKRALAITVDDGYADFGRAWRLLKTFQLPATLFVVSGFANQEFWLWPDVVQYCLARSPLKRIVIEMPDGRPSEYSLNAERDRQAADTHLDEQLLAMPDDDRRRIIAELPRLAGLSLPSQIPDEYAPLRWQDLRNMVAEGLEVGAHTETHPVLSRIGSASLLQREIVGSKAAIEDSLGVPVRHFCYPNGQVADFNAASVEAVRGAGFWSAATAARGLNRPNVSHLELRRIGVDPFMPTDLFELELAGFRMA